MTRQQFTEDFIARVRKTRTTRWIRFGLVALLWLAFTVWTSCWWLLLVLPLLFDIYITHYIPFTWWKNSKSTVVRGIMSWVDAIVYALILVWFIFNFVAQNYSIPSSSLEKTLLTGDYITVNKLIYGPRVPITPINFPLVHNTMPLVGGNSYVESVQFKYRRLPGLRSVERGDIVVFNFPAGDTVFTNVSNPDYYQLCQIAGVSSLAGNPQLGEKITRPVDRRENYVKRCVGLPGETFKIVNGDIYIDGKKQPMPRNAQFNYYVQIDRPITDAEWDELEISQLDRNNYADLNQLPADFWLSNGFTVNPDGTVPRIYRVPLTASMLAQVKKLPGVLNIVQQPGEDEYCYIWPFSLAANEGWTRLNYGGSDGVLIPKKGMTVELDERNWQLYERAIRVYEGHTNSEFRNGQAYIDGKPAKTYTFGMDYYFMLGDNRDNSVDSRYWGFVPEDHIVGMPVKVLTSFDGDKSLFNGKIRFNRTFKNPNPDKADYQQ